MRGLRFIALVFFSFMGLNSSSQEVFPVYSDYLSDNVYLVHPSAAGIGNCGKIRFTYRKQWMDAQEAPSLQTLSFHTRITDKMALGAIAFNDENGFHAQRGFLGTYAYHLNLGRSDAMNQLSFGLSLMYSQNSIDQSSFNPQIPDPSISGINESSGYFNADVSFGYHYMDGFSYLTVKNVFLTERGLVDNQFETNNLRRYLFTLGYYWGREKSFQLEPSLMFQLVEYTGEFLTDINLKAYKDVSSKTTLWAALSYRMNFEGDSPESFKQITPIVGLNYKRLMISYTYSSQLGDLTYDQGGHHQFTLGFDVLCTPPRATGCPNLNTRY